MIFLFSIFLFSRRHFYNLVIEILDMGFPLNGLDYFGRLLIFLLFFFKKIYIQLNALKV